MLVHGLRVAPESICLTDVCKLYYAQISLLGVYSFQIVLRRTQDIRILQKVLLHNAKSLHTQWSAVMNTVRCMKLIYTKTMMTDQ